MGEGWRVMVRMRGDGEGWSVRVRGGRYRNVCVVQRCTNTMYILST